MFRAAYDDVDATQLAARAIAIAAFVTGAPVAETSGVTTWARESIAARHGRWTRAKVLDPAMEFAAARTWLHRFQDVGLVSNLPHRVAFTTGPTSDGADSCTEEGWIRGIFFEPMVGGIPVTSALCRVSVTADGSLHGAATVPFHLDPAGSRRAASSGDAAIARFERLARATHPSAKLHWHKKEIVYPLPERAAAFVEPRVLGMFVPDVNGVAGRPVGYTLSLTDPRAQLVDM